MNGTRILLLRHGEKTGAINDVHLSQEGYARAVKLADYIPATFGQPQFLIATAPSAHSIRPIETITPLSQKTGVPVVAQYADKYFEPLSAQLLMDPAFSGALVVLCRHHGQIPNLAASLRAPPGSYPAPWDDNVFNLILDMRYGADGVPQVTTVTQPF